MLLSLHLFTTTPRLWVPYFSARLRSLRASVSAGSSGFVTIMVYLPLPARKRLLSKAGGRVDEYEVAASDELVEHVHELLESQSQLPKRYVGRST